MLRLWHKCFCCALFAFFYQLNFSLFIRNLHLLKYLFIFCSRLLFHLLPCPVLSTQNALTIISVIGFFSAVEIAEKRRRRQRRSRMKSRKAYKKHQEQRWKRKVSREASTIGRWWNRPFCYLCSHWNIKCCLVLWFRICVFFSSLLFLSCWLSFFQFWRNFHSHIVDCARCYSNQSNRFLGEA